MKNQLRNFQGLAAQVDMFSQFISYMFVYESIKITPRVEIQSKIHPPQKKVWFPDAVSYSLPNLDVFFVFSPPFPWPSRKKITILIHTPRHGCIPHRWYPRVASPRTWHVQPHRWRPDLHRFFRGCGACSLGENFTGFWGFMGCALEEKKWDEQTRHKWHQVIHTCGILASHMRYSNKQNNFFI